MYCLPVRMLLMAKHRIDLITPWLLLYTVAQSKLGRIDDYSIYTNKEYVDRHCRSSHGRRSVDKRVSSECCCRIHDVVFSSLSASSLWQMKYEGVIASNLGLFFCLLVGVVKMIFVECRFRLSGAAFGDSCLLLVVGSADCYLSVSLSVVLLVPAWL